MTLPLTDGALIIDNSTIELLKCPRLFEYQAIRRKVPVAEQAGRNFGSALHAGWATRYLECGNMAITPEVEAKVNEAMRQWFVSNPQPEGDFRNYSHAEAVMKMYNKVYGNEPFKILTDKKGKPIVESSFLLPLTTIDGVDCYYSGKIDLGVEDNVGIWAGPDHKSSAIIGIPYFGDIWEQQMQVDGGQLGYCWSLQQVRGEKPNGYLIDAVRIRRPKRGDEYTGTPPVDATDFRRFPVFVGQEDLDDWYKDTVALVKTLFYHASQNYFPRHRWNCTNKFGTCAFYDVCSLSPSQRENALGSTLYKDNTWSPLKQ